MVLQSQKSRKCRDPFAVDPLPKAHYHPSKQKQLTSEQRKTAISPKKSGQQLKPEEEERVSSPADEIFLRGGKFCSAKSLEKDHDDDSNKFDETWPSTERPSFISSTGEEDQSPLSINKLLQQIQGRDQHRSFLDLKQNLKSKDRDERVSQTQQKSQIKSKCSTLQRYIERFRKGEPMSREERQRKSGSNSTDFWWISDHPSPPSDTSTPREDSQSVAKPFSSYRNQTTDKATASPMDERTRRLQERADQLLERSISTVASSDPVVSTDGLGSSPGCTMSSFDEPPYRPTFTRDLGRNPIPKFQLDMPFSERHTTAGKPVVTFPRVSKPSRPEDDILHQWRVRRRLEEARSAADKKSSKTNKFGFLTKPKDQMWTNRIEEYQPESKPSYTNRIDDCQPESKPSYTPVASPTLKKNSKPVDVDPHLHLMCDLLPCPHQQEYRINSQEIETHYKYLQAERPDVEKQTSKAKPENKDQSVTESESRTVIDQTKQNKHITSVPERQSEYSNIPGKSKSECSNIPGKSKSEYSNIPGKSKSECSNIPGKSKSDETTKQDSCYKDSTVKQKSVTIQENHGSDDSVGEVVAGKQSKTADNVKGDEKILKPRRCTSPSGENHKQPVENIIGQVVKNRLFTASTSTVISSIDSVSSVTAPQSHLNVSSTEWHSLSDPYDTEQGNRHPDKEQRNRRQDTEQRNKCQDTEQRNKRHIQPSPKQSFSKEKFEAEDADEIYQSDGEFPEDQLLQMLRQQRSQYEKQLQHIDKMLAGKHGRGKGGD